jgi:hypothetical protein
MKPGHPESAGNLPWKNRETLASPEHALKMAE